MRAGNLDRRIQFRRFTLVDDGFGQVEEWADHGSPVWAQKTDASDGEQWRASQVQATITSRFLVRYSAFTAEITPRDRLVFGGVVYAITGIREPQGTRRQWLEVSATARPDLTAYDPVFEPDVFEEDVFA